MKYDAVDWLLLLLDVVTVGSAIYFLYFGY